MLWWQLILLWEQFILFLWQLKVTTTLVCCCVDNYFVETTQSFPTGRLSSLCRHSVTCLEWFNSKIGFGNVIRDCESLGNEVFTLYAQNWMEEKRLPGENIRRKRIFFCVSGRDRQSLIQGGLIYYGRSGYLWNIHVNPPVLRTQSQNACK